MWCTHTEYTADWSHGVVLSVLTWPQGLDFLHFTLFVSPAQVGCALGIRLIICRYRIRWHKFRIICQRHFPRKTVVV